MSKEQSNNLWLFLEVLGKRRNLIVTIVFLITFGAVLVSLILPKWYASQTLLLPPKDLSTSVSGMSAFAEAFSITSGLNLPVMVTPTDVYSRMLKSRLIAQRIIDRFDLKERYETATSDETYDALMYHSQFKPTEEGLLAIIVEDKDPQTAADMANAFVEELDNINKEIVAQRIQQIKKFIEDRLDQVMLDMDSSRFELEQFQLKYRAVDFDEQTRLAIEQAANLKVGLAQVDLDIKMNEIKLGSENSQLKELKLKRKIIKNQLSQLETTNPDSSFFSLPVASIPKLRGKYETLFSRVKVSETLYQILLEQREQAKLREFEKMPTISILDFAQASELKSRPKRSYIVLTALFLSLMFSIFLAASLEYLSRLQTDYPEDYNRFQLFAAAYFGWLPGVKKKSNLSQ